MNVSKYDVDTQIGNVSKAILHLLEKTEKAYHHKIVSEAIGNFLFDILKEVRFPENDTANNDELSQELQITAYMHCKQCLDELPDGVSPKDWARTQTGWTPRGIQIWCNRHEINVCNIDFQGYQHPAV